LNRVILTRDYVEFKFSNLKQCLYKRKTVRIFKSQEISKELLSTLLYYSFGYIHDVDKSSDNIFDIARRKATPSGGNLHPTEVYIITNNITSLENSLYHYNAENHALDCIQQNITLEWLPQALLGQHFSVSANIHVFLTFKFNVGAWKYPHSRGYRAALLDVGHLSQTFQLVSTALGLNTWITGAFEDTKINTVLNIDGENESTLFYLSAGMSDGQSIPLEFSQIAQELAVV
jgi:SagB-type dehydrogenase family enzyme